MITLTIPVTLPAIEVYLGDGFKPICGTKEKHCMFLRLPNYCRFPNKEAWLEINGVRERIPHKGCPVWGEFP